MPFSDDEQITFIKHTPLKKCILIGAILLYTMSLITPAYCTDQGCQLSIMAFLFGWIDMLLLGAGISWIANPLLMIAWFLLMKNKKAAWIFSLLATLASLLFLGFDSIIINEAGTNALIQKIGTGYWLWLSSCLVTLTGSVAIGLFSLK